MVSLPQKKCYPKGGQRDTDKHTRIHRGGAKTISAGLEEGEEQDFGSFSSSFQLWRFPEDEISVNYWNFPAYFWKLGALEKEII